MSRSEPAARESISWLMFGIFAWSVVIAIGIVLYDYWMQRVNLVKPLVVILTTLAMIGVWRFALRRRRNRAEPRDPQN